MQRADGAFGPLIIREPYDKLPMPIKEVILEPYLNDHIMIVQDWNHETGLNSFNSFHHSIGDNKPKNILINGKGKNYEEEIQLDEKKTLFEVFEVSKFMKYRFRLINAGYLNCPFEISIDNHTLIIIASDGHYIEPITVDSLVSYAGERFDFVIETTNDVDNYWIRVKGLMDCDERFFKSHQAAVLRYAGADNGFPNSSLSYDHQRGGIQMNSLNRGPGLIDSVAIVESTALEPDTPELLTEHTDFKFHVFFDFYEKDFPQFNNPNLYSISKVSKVGDKFFGPQLNDISMEMPPKPFLIGRELNHDSEFCNSSSLMEQQIDCRHQFCTCQHILQVPLNATVEVILIDEGKKYDANHPFHLHGHDFRVVAMGRLQPTGITLDEVGWSFVGYMASTVRY